MGEYVCRLADANGRVFSHVEAAASQEEARQKLSDRGLYIYSVETRSSLITGMLGVRKERKISGNDFLILNQQFNTLIKAGLPILKALDLLATRATAPKLRPILVQVRDRVREGKSLSEAIEEAGVFSKVYVTSILAGEKSGNLSGVLDYYIAYQKLSTGVRKKLIATLIYPAILVTVATLIVTYLVTYVVPQFGKLYSDMNVQLPGVTRLLLTLTVSYRFHVLIAVAVLIVGALGLFAWSRTDNGGTAADRVTLKLPVVVTPWL